MVIQNEMTLVSVGTVEKEDDRWSIVLDPTYRDGLAGIEQLRLSCNLEYGFPQPQL